MDRWEEVAGRRESKTLLVNRIRRAVDDDIAIPRATPLYERHYRRLHELDPLKLPPLASQQDLEGELRNRIDLLHGIIDIKVGSGEVEFNAENVPPIENLLSSLTGRVERHARLTGQFDVLYPKVREYVWKRCFGGVWHFLCQPLCGPTQPVRVQDRKV